MKRRRRAEAALWRGLPIGIDKQEARAAPDLPLPPKPITLGRPAFIAAIVTVVAALAIWFWRRQRLLEQGA